MNYELIRQILDILRCCVYLFIYLLLIYFLYLMLCLKPYHPNLRCLLILMPHTVALSTVRFFAENIWNFGGSELPRVFKEILFQVTTIALIANSFALLSVAGERLLAAIYVGKYEMFTGGKPYLAIVFYILGLIVSVLMDLSITHGIISNYVVYGILLTNILFGTVFFLLLPKVTDMHFSVHNKNRFQLKVTVSEKYMQNENVKSARMMSILGPFLSISTLLLLFYFWLIYEHFQQRDLLKGVLLQIFYLIEPMLAIGIILITIVSHNRLRLHLFSLVHLKSKRSIDIRLTQEEADVYFTRIKEAWK